MVEITFKEPVSLESVRKWPLYLQSWAKYLEQNREIQ